MSNLVSCCDASNANPSINRKRYSLYFIDEEGVPIWVFDSSYVATKRGYQKLVHDPMEHNIGDKFRYKYYLVVERDNDLILLSWNRFTKKWDLGNR